MLARTFFPPTPRSFPGRRAVKILLRAVHVLCAGLLVGSHVFDAAADDQSLWLITTLVSGVLMLLLDMHETCVFLFQVRGAVIVSKLVVLGSLEYLGSARGWVLAILFLVSVVSSHAPGRFRYHVLWFRDRFAGARSHG